MGELIALYDAARTLVWSLGILYHGSAARLHSCWEPAYISRGSWSTGEFASTLQAILSPASDALFTKKRSTSLENRPAWRYDFMIEQPRSSWQVYAGGSRYRPAYGGTIWIDKETSRVLRIEMDARNIPNEFPLDHVESAVDYSFVNIGAKKYLLPTHSESLSCNRGTTECTRNSIDFRNYKKYGAESNVTFDSPPASK